MIPALFPPGVASASDPCCVFPEHRGVSPPPPLARTVGVIVVTHNSALHIAQCLNSLRAATRVAALRVVVIDNASADRSADLAREAWPGAQVVENSRNVGFARAVNAAARLLGDCAYILLLNPDATTQPESLDALLAGLEATPTIGATGPHLLYPDGRHQISARPLPTLTGIIYDSLLLYHLRSRPDLVEQYPSDGRPMEVGCLSGACLLVRRSDFEALEGLDERFFLYAEDIDLCARLRASGRTLVLVPEAVVHHVEGASAFKDRGLFFREIHRARAAYVKKHFGPGRAVLAIAFQLAGLALRGSLYPLAAWFGRADLTPQARHQWSSLAAVVGWPREQPQPQSLAPQPARAPGDIQLQ